MLHLVVLAVMGVLLEASAVVVGHLVVLEVHVGQILEKTEVPYEDREVHEDQIFDQNEVLYGQMVDPRGQMGDQMVDHHVGMEVS